jgi:hypothetical protein
MSQNNHAIRAHAKYSASASDRWMSCAGSVALCEQVPSKTSPYAEEGTKAHELAEKILKQIPTITGEYSDEMKEFVKEYTSYCSSLMQQTQKFKIEKKFAYSNDIGGTVDFMAIIKDTLHIVDLKYGAGQQVSPEDNSQLMFYAALALTELKDPIITKVRLTIVQPRNGGISHADMDAERIANHMKRILKRIEYIEANTTEYVPSESACFFCAGKMMCPAFKSKAVDEVKALFAPQTPSQPVNLKSMPMHVLLDLADMADMFSSEVRKLAFEEANSGNVPEGYKLVAKRAMRKWNNEAQAIEMLSKVKPMSEICELKSPAQMEKILDKTIVNELCSAISSGVSLVKESSKRPEVKLGSQLFGTYELKAENLILRNKLK